MRPGLLAGGRWGAQCPGPPCLPGERRGETGLPWAPHVCPGVAAGAPEDHSQEGRAGAAPERRQGLLRCRQVAARAPPPPLQRRGRGTRPRPWRSQDGDQRSARGAGLGGLAGTCRSSTPSEVLPVGGGGGASPQTHDLQARPSEEARRSCGHVTPRPAPTTAGRTGVTARRLRPPPSRPGLGTPDSVSSHWPPEVPAPQPEACPARPHLLSPSPPATRLSCCLRRLQPRPMPRPAPQPLGLWSFVAAAPGEYRLL